MSDHDRQRDPPGDGRAVALTGAWLPDPPPPARTADVLGIAGLEQSEQIGKGASGTVWRARQPRFDRWIAVKVVDIRIGEAAARRFARECRTLGGLSAHPNIVTLLDAGVTAGGQPYLAMPFFDRGSLADQLDRHGAIAWPRVAEIGVKIAAALQTAHEAGILHRDVKPENVLVSRYGEPQLADFGLALDPSSQTRTSNVVGTPLHAAPEMLAGGRATPRSDVYALGSMIFRLLAGVPAFYRASDRTMLPLLRRVVTEPTPDLTAYGTPPAIAWAITWAMAKDPADRPQSARAFAVALQEAERVLGLAITPIPGDTADWGTTPSKPAGSSKSESEPAPEASPVPARPVGHRPASPVAGPKHPSVPPPFLAPPSDARSSPPPHGRPYPPPPGTPPPRVDPPAGAPTSSSAGSPSAGRASGAQGPASPDRACAQPRRRPLGPPALSMDSVPSFGPPCAPPPGALNNAGEHAGRPAGPSVGGFPAAGRHR